MPEPFHMTIVNKEVKIQLPFVYLKLHSNLSNLTWLDFKEAETR